MLKKILRWATVYVSAGIGAVVVWLLMNWLPNTTIIAGAIGSGYIAWLLTKKK